MDERIAELIEAVGWSVLYLPAPRSRPLSQRISAGLGALVVSTSVYPTRLPGDRRSESVIFDAVS
jgi:hypothetical protein